MNNFCNFSLNLATALIAGWIAESLCRGLGMYAAALAGAMVRFRL